MPQGQTTPEKTLSNPFYGKGFCDPNQYKAAIDRCEGGYHSLDLGIDIYKRAHKLMESHSQDWHDWAKSSIRQISESKEFGHNKKAWICSVRAVEKITEANDKIAENIKTNVIEPMTSFKNENYGKSFIHVRQIKEFEKEFRKAQRTWLDCVEKINEAKQLYHEAAKKLCSAKNAEEAKKSDVSSSDEEKKKIHNSVERREADTKSARSKYESALKDAEPKQKKYETEMLAILKRTDEFEKKRLDHFKTIIESLQKSLVLQHTTYDTQLSDAFTEATSEHNSEKDIEYFNTHYGAGKPSVWPVFEEWKPS